MAKRTLDPDLLLATLNKRIELALLMAQKTNTVLDTESWSMRIQVLREMVTLVEGLAREVVK